MKRGIFVVTTDYKPSLGGVAEMTYQVALGFSRAGWRVVVLAPEGDDNGFDAKQPFETVRVLPVEFGGPLRTLRWTMDLTRFRRRLKDIANERGIRYVLNMDSGGYESLSGYLRSRALDALKLPQGIMFYGRDVVTFPTFPWHRRKLYRSIVARVHDVYCISRFTGEQAVASFGDGLEPIITGAGVRPELLPARVDRRAARGRLVPRKGIDMVIRAMPRVLSEVDDVLYLVAGAGPDLERLRGLAEEVGCAADVRFDGRFEDELLAHYYGAADVFVMPARYVPGEDAEGFGIVYAEAGHYGLPVIGGRAGGALDAVIDGHTGLLVDPENVEEIAAGLTTLLKDPPLRRQLGHAGRIHVRRRLTWDEVVKRFEEGVRSTLAGTG